MWSKPWQNCVSLVSGFCSSVRKERKIPPLLVARRSRGSEGRLIAAVQHALLGVLIRPTNPNHFRQKLDIFNNGEERICSVLVWYKSGPKKRHQGRSGRLEVVGSQSRRQSAILFELYGNSHVTGALPRFVRGRMTLGD